MKKALVLAIVYCQIALGFTQDTAVYYNLKTTDVTDDQSDLQQLDAYFENVTLVGMGEATHGTHEFFTMRHRVFKYLVEKHDFNTFFLEADYANCLAANNYINSDAPANENEAINAVLGFGLWPWITEEMVDLVNWMKQYNLNHPNNKLSFIGVDVQKYWNTLIKMDEILTKNGLPTADTSIVRVKNAENFEKILKAKQDQDIKQFEEKDRETYSELLIHLEQIIEGLNNPKDYFYRDRKMGENIYTYLQKDSTLKGFFWTHNGHIGKFGHKKLFSRKWEGGAGGYLNEKFRKRYFSLGQTFDSGSFNAYAPINESAKIENGKDGFALQSISVTDSKEKTFAAYYKHLGTPIFIEQNYIPKDIQSKKYFLMNGIGAVYLGEEIGGNYRYLYYLMDNFDAMILINRSTPTHLL